MRLLFKKKSPIKNVPQIRHLTLELGGGVDVPVEIRPNRGSNRIRMRLARDGQGVLISAPSYTDTEIIRKFIISNRDWLLKNRVNNQYIRLEPNKIIPIFGRPTILEIAKPRTKIEYIKFDNYYSFDGSKINGAPEPVARITIPSTDMNFEEKARVVIRKMALAKANEFVAEFAPKLIRKPTKISVRDTKSRWGSCNTRGHISFSWRLVYAPDMVFKEVVAHELAHLKEMNHSKAFYAEVERIMPEYREHKDWLKKHGRTLHFIG